MDSEIPQSKMMFADNKKVSQFVFYLTYYRKRSSLQHKPLAPKLLTMPLPRRIGPRQPPLPPSRQRKQKQKPSKKKKRPMKLSAMLKKKSRSVLRPKRLSLLQ